MATTALILPRSFTPEAETVSPQAEKILTALPPGVNREYFAVSMISAFNEMAERCDKWSTLMSAFNCAAVGLVPGSALGHAYFVPFKDKNQKLHRCVFMPGYRGFLELAFANNFLVQCDPQVVLKGEDYRFFHNTDGPQVEHDFPVDRDLHRDNVIAAYCTYKTRFGGRGVVCVTRQELDRVDTGRNVWKYDYVAMAMKTAIRRAAKRWRCTREMGMAINLDEMQEVGKIQDLGNMPQDRTESFSLKELSTDDSSTDREYTTEDLEHHMNNVFACETRDDADLLCEISGESVSYDHAMTDNKIADKVIKSLFKYSEECHIDLDDVLNHARKARNSK